MVGYYNQGVPTSVDLENNSNQKKYTVNQPKKKGLVISKPLCALMAIGAFLLALLVGLLVFFLVPRYCNGEKHPQALTQTHSQQLNNNNNNIVTNNKADEKDTRNSAESDVDERLPRSISPSHYRIRIQPDFENLTTSGSVKMILSVLEDTKDIFFHLRDIKILDHSVSVISTKPDSSPLEITRQEYLPGDKYRINLKSDLKKGEVYQLYLDYDGELNRHLKSFYIGDYQDLNGQKKPVASTQFSPTDARGAFPCFDEPSFKARFSIAVARPFNMTTLSNMPLFNSTSFTNPSTQDTWYWDEYPETPKMSTYLVAFVVSDLKSDLKSENSHPVMKIWAREDLLPQTNYVAEIGPKVLKFYEEYFDIKFPLEKIDIIGLPAFGFEAMENWGLITYREASILLDPKSSTSSHKRGVATTLAHELAHQWFGNLVTPKFWNDLWLKEGFANYMMYLAINNAEPSWRLLDEFDKSQTSEAMKEDSFGSSRPISSDEVKNTREIRQLFDSLSYSKGAAIINMMNHFLGEATFKEGIINFLKKYQYDNADRHELFAVLTEVAHKNGVLNPDENVSTIMDTWTGVAGYPVINAFPNHGEQKLTISQKRFYYSHKDENSHWWVPLSFTSNSTDNTPNFTDTYPKFWLKGQSELETDVNLTREDWYLINIERTGYFIVNYDTRNWEKLAENIMDLPPLIRSQLISDSMNLARANLLNYNIPLSMIANMAVQDNAIMFIPTETALNTLSYLKKVLYSTPAYGLFEEYHKNIFQDTYKKVILEDTPDDYITRSIQILILSWSCDSPDTRCTHMAKTAFRDWIVRGREVPQNLKSVVYCTAIREGGEIEWNFAYTKFLEASSPLEKNLILDALGCTNLEWLLSRYVDKILHDNSISIQNAPRVFSSVAKNKVGVRIAFDFLRKNWHAIVKQHGDGFNIVSRMVKNVGTRLTTQFELSEFIRFYDSIKGNLSTATRAFESVIEQIQANVEWTEKKYDEVEQWLRNNRDLRTRIREKLRIQTYPSSTRGARRA